MHRLFVTGVTGFIGSAVARRALALGWPVAGLALPAETIPPDLVAQPGFVALRGTLENLPWDGIRLFAPTRCLHTAWIATPGVYLESPENWKHLEWGLQLAEGLLGLGCPHLTVLGTCIEYQSNPQPCLETGTPIQPTTTYSRCKHELHLKLADQFVGRGGQLAWARVFYPYGVGEHPARLGSQMIKRMAAGEPAVLTTPESIKDYIYIDDLSAAICQVVGAGFQGPVNLGTGTGVSIRQIAQLVAQMLGKDGLITERPSGTDPFPFVVADNTALRQLGWSPGTGISAGLRQLAQSLGHVGR